MSKKKGSRLERELLHLLFARGFGVCRVAGSGSTSLPSVDIVAGKNGKVFCIECKSGKEKRYISQEQIKKLRLFSRKFGATPLVAVRFNHSGWYFMPPRILTKTEGKNYVVSRELAKLKGMAFKEFMKWKT